MSDRRSEIGDRRAPGRRMTIGEQAAEAIRMTDSLFGAPTPPPPEDATIESLWAELLALRDKGKRGRRPKVVDAVKALLEHDELTGLSPALIADVVSKVFARRGIPCKTTEACVRWYVSQNTLHWNVKPRDKPQKELLQID